MRIAPKYSFQRPDNTTQYAQNELVANDATAALVLPMRFSVEAVFGRGRIDRVRLFTDNQNVTTATFNLHIFSADPGVPGAGDNGTYSVGSVRNWVGTVACDMATASEVTSTDKAKGFAITGGRGFDTKMGAGGTAARWALLETATAATYTPAALELFEACLEFEG